MVDSGKIKVAGPVVEMDGDEMTRIIWHIIRDKVTHTRIPNLFFLYSSFFPTWTSTSSTST
jgi:hypothetical protein